jgi:hypothetical protein
VPQGVEVRVLFWAPNIKTALLLDLSFVRFFYMPKTMQTNFAKQQILKTLRILTQVNTLSAPHYPLIRTHFGV